MGKSLKQLTSFLKPYWKQLILVALLSIVIVLMVALAPLIEGNITTQLLSDVKDIAQGVKGAQIQVDVIFRFLTILFVVYTLNAGLRLILQSLLANAIQSATYDLRIAVKEKITRVPIRYYDAHQTGDLMSRMSTDVEAISNALQQSFAAIFQAIIMLVVAIIMMFVIDVQLAWIGISIIPLTLIASRFIVKHSQIGFRNTQKALGNLNAITQENLTGFAQIKLYNYQEETIQTFKKANEALCEYGFKSSFVSGLMGPSVSMLTYLAIATTIFLGANKVLAGAMLVGNLQAFIRYVWQVNQPMSQMTQLSAAIQSSFAAMDRVFGFLNEADDIKDPDYPVIPTPFQGAVSFNHVEFGYNSTPIIKDLSAEIQPGQLVAIVGPTGAGKTTLINLLMRFYDVEKGSIKIDGVDLRDMNRDTLRSYFGMVLQDTWLFSGSIADNIRYGKKDATMDEVIEASKKANVHHFIQTLPDGYDMILNEETNNISNGEKQLITIARALLSDPKIMILDEATSSIDTRLDQRIQDALQTAMQGRTSFVIAHRLTTIRNADIILVVRDGNIVEQGNHEQLLQNKGFYAELYNSQFELAKD
nr:ABC transporter ATP-binding protein [Erysipelothrix larvae]